MSRTSTAKSPAIAPEKISTERRLLWIRLLLIAVTLAAFCRAMTADFTNWDDSQTTYANPHLDPPTLGNIGWFWSHAYMDIYAPLPFTMWGGLLLISKLPVPDQMGVAFNPWIFHAANLLLHIIAVLAAFELLRCLVKHKGAAAVGALLFAVHPVQVEPVAWISGAKDLLYGLFALIALWQYVQYAQAAPASHEQNETTRPPVHYILASLAFVLALFSKPTAVVVPLLAFVIDCWLLRRSWRKSLAVLWPWFVLSVLFAVIAKLAQPAPNVEWSYWSRPVVAADALAFYLYKLIYPVHLAVDYGRNPGWLMHSSVRYWTWVVPVLVALGMWLARKRARWLAAGGLLFLICLLPVLGLSPFDFQLYSTVADHYLYLAMIGPALVAGSLLAQWWRAIHVVIAAIVLAALATGTFLQTRHWQNTLTLFQHNLAVNPHSGLSHQNLGTYYMHLGVMQTQRAEFWQSVEQANLRQGHLKDAHEAQQEAETLTADARRNFLNGQLQTRLALQIYPTWPVLNINLAEAMGDLDEYDQAMAQLRAVDQMKQSYPPRVRQQYGSRWFDEGMTAYQRGEDRLAVKYFAQGALGQPRDILSSHAIMILGRKLKNMPASRPVHSEP